MPRNRRLLQPVIAALMRIGVAAIVGLSHRPAVHRIRDVSSRPARTGRADELGVFVAGWPWLSRFGLYRGGDSRKRFTRGGACRERCLLCRRTQVGSRASQPVPPYGKYNIFRKIRQRIVYPVASMRPPHCKQLSKSTFASCDSPASAAPAGGAQELLFRDRAVGVFVDLFQAGLHSLIDFISGQLSVAVLVLLGEDRSSITALGFRSDG